MSEESKVLSIAQSAEAVQATAVAAEAVEKARIAQLDDRISKGLEEFFNRGVERKQFVQTRNLPMICDDLHGVHSELKDMRENSVTKTDFLLLKQQSDLTNKIVLGAVAIILVAFIGGLTVLVFKS